MTEKQTSNVVADASSTSDAPLQPRAASDTNKILKAWSAGEPAPTTLYRNARGELCEAVVMEEPHEVLVEQGKKVSALTAELVRAHLEQDDTKRLTLPS